MEKQSCYALIDGAAESELQPMLEQENPPHCCLYAEPIQPQMLALAPWLIEVTPPVAAWLKTRDTPWGIYLDSQADMKTLRQHLRKYLHVLIPGQEKPVYFRFYDPRNIWDLLPGFSDWELHSFLGPITTLKTAYQGVERQDNFAAARAPFPEGIKINQKMLKISVEHYEKIGQAVAERYINTLVQDIEHYWQLTKVPEEERQAKIFAREMRLIERGELFSAPPADEESEPPQDAQALARSCVLFCQENGISDDQSIRAVIHLLLERKLHDIDSAPAAWRDALAGNQTPGHYRVDALLFKELGQFPAVAHLRKGK